MRIFYLGSFCLAHLYWFAYFILNRTDVQTWVKSGWRRSYQPRLYIIDYTFLVAWQAPLVVEVSKGNENRSAEYLSDNGTISVLDSLVFLGYLSGYPRSCDCIRYNAQFTMITKNYASNKTYIKDTYKYISWTGLVIVLLVLETLLLFFWILTGYPRSCDCIRNNAQLTMITKVYASNKTYI